jgi:hypothetical protein
MIALPEPRGSATSILPPPPNLKVGGAAADLLVVRHEEEVSVNVLRRAGNVEVVVEV